MAHDRNLEDYRLQPPDEPLCSECDGCHTMFRTDDLYFIRRKHLETWLCAECAEAFAVIEALDALAAKGGSMIPLLHAIIDWLEDHEPVFCFACRNPLMHMNAHLVVTTSGQQVHLCDKLPCARN